MAGIMLKNALRIIGALTTAVLLGSAVAPANADETGRRLVLGRITGEPHKHLERMRAMADYLAIRLADQGIAGVDVAIADSPARMRGLLEEGKVDLLSETAFVAVEFMNAGIAKPLLREWKKGVAEYHSVIFVRKDSGVKTLSDLVDRKFAFEDPGSTSGYLIPRVALEDSGLRLALLPDPRNPVPDGALGYSFANGEINVVAWVNRGLADGGAISNLDWDDPDTAPADLKDGLHIIHETKPVIRSLMLARQSLDDGLRERITVILETMHESAEGRAVLKKYAKVARYDRLEGEAGRGLEEAQSILQRLGGQGD